MSIAIRQISKQFGSFTALRDVNLDIDSGELLALLGPSGCGKTTLLRIIAGLESPDQGSVLFAGADATDTHARERNVGFVFQHYALFRHMTIFENVAFGLRVRPRPLRPSEPEIRQRVMDLLSLVQLDWLADVLSAPAPLGSVLALHHPPVPTPLEVMAVLELQRQADLAAVVRGSDVRAILGGHLHYSTHSTFAGIPVHVASATCYTLDLGADARRLLSGVDGGQSFDVVHVYDDVVVSSTVPLAAFPEVTGYSIDYRPLIERMTPADRLERLSSKTSPPSLGESAGPER